MAFKRGIYDFSRCMALQEVEQNREAVRYSLRAKARIFPPRLGWEVHFSAIPGNSEWCLVAFEQRLSMRKARKLAVIIAEALLQDFPWRDKKFRFRVESEEPWPLS